MKRDIMGIARIGKPIPNPALPIPWTKTDSKATT
jgi:hypothetical protein